MKKEPYKFEFWHVIAFLPALTLAALYYLVRFYLDLTLKRKLQKKVDAFEFVDLNREIFTNGYNSSVVIPAHARLCQADESPEKGLLSDLFGNYHDGQVSSAYPGGKVYNSLQWWLRNPCHNLTFFTLGQRGDFRIEFYYDLDFKPIAIDDSFFKSIPQSYYIVSATSSRVDVGYKKERSYRGIRFYGSWGVR